ncbi:MAG: mechanosensitive ion channel [Isosphaeraceae bacterium]
MAMTVLAPIAFLIATLSVAQEVPRADDPTMARRYGTPRATVRSLHGFLELARLDPKQIAGATACLDTGDLPPGAPTAGLLATKLDTVLRAREIAPSLVPDDPTLGSFELPAFQGHTIALRKGTDGLFRFDRATVAAIPEMWMQVQQLVRDHNRELAAINVSPEFATPRSTFRTFLLALTRSDLDRASRCLDLDDIPTVCRREVGRQLVVRLKQVIDRERVAGLADIPDTNYADPYVWLSETAGVIELAREFDGPRKGEWLFSAETVASIDRLFDESEERPFDAALLGLSSYRIEADPMGATELWLRAKLPPSMRRHILALRALNFEVYQMPAAILGVAAAWLMGLGARRVLGRLISLWMRRKGIALVREAIDARIRPIGFLAAALTFRWVALLLCLDTPVLILCLSLLNPLIWILAAWALYRLIDLIGDVIDVSMIRANRGSEVALMIWPVASLAAKLVILVAILFRLMTIFNWDLSAILTGLGISGLAFALGAQDSLKNLFGSITLIADRPFVVGDKVKIGGTEEGTVEMVGLRSTRIRGADDTLITIPNSNLTTMMIANPGRRRFRQYKTTLTIGHGTPTDRLLAFRDGIRKLILDHPAGRKGGHQVAVKDVCPDSIDIAVKAEFDVTGREAEDDARERLIVGILQLADELGISLARPQASTTVTLADARGNGPAIKAEAAPA